SRRNATWSSPTCTALGVPRCSVGPCLPHRVGAGVTALERQLESAGRTVTVLANTDEHGAGVRVVVAVEEHDHVGVLLDSARLAQVRDGGLRSRLCTVPVQLGQDDDGDVHLLSELLECAGVD